MEEKLIKLTSTRGSTSAVWVFVFEVLTLVYRFLNPCVVGAPVDGFSLSEES